MRKFPFYIQAAYLTIAVIGLFLSANGSLPAYSYSLARANLMYALYFVSAITGILASLSFLYAVVRLQPTSDSQYRSLAISGWIGTLSGAVIIGLLFVPPRWYFIPGVYSMINGIAEIGLVIFFISIVAFFINSKPFIPSRPYMTGLVLVWLYTITQATAIATPSITGIGIGYQSFFLLPNNSMPALIWILFVCVALCAFFMLSRHAEHGRARIYGMYIEAIGLCCALWSAGEFLLQSLPKTIHIWVASSALIAFMLGTALLLYAHRKTPCQRTYKLIVLLFFSVTMIASIYAAGLIYDLGFVFTIYPPTPPVF